MQKLEIKDREYYIVNDIYGYSSRFPHTYTDTLYRDIQGRIFRYVKDREFLLFDFSLEDGQSYKYDDFIVTVKKVGLIEMTTGNFDNCIEFFFDIPVSIDEENWYTFAPQVGLIKKIVGEGVGFVLNSYEF